MTTIESNQSSNRKYIVTGAAILAVAVGAYGLGRVYPPLGPVEGTIAPAQRHVNPQIASGDVTLGDTSIPQLMQTDAFEVMSKNPSFRALAADPNFAALAQNSQVMAVVAANPQAFSSLAANPAAFLATLNSAKAVSAASGSVNANHGQAFAVMAQHAVGFESLARPPQALHAIAHRAFGDPDLLRDGRERHAPVLLQEGDDLPVDLGVLAEVIGRGFLFLHAAPPGRRRSLGEQWRCGDAYAEYATNMTARYEKRTTKANILLITQVDGHSLAECHPLNCAGRSDPARPSRGRTGFSRRPGFRSVFPRT